MTRNGMVEYKTMRVPEDAWEIANAARGENETWGEYLRRCADEPILRMSESDVEAIIDRRIDAKVIDEALL